jgi:hypothetical protein
MKTPTNRESRRYLQMYYGNNLDFNSSVLRGSISKARAKKIHRLSLGNRDPGSIFSYSCVKQAKYRNKLSHTERIMLEQKWTDLMLELLRVGNIRVMHSIHYRLREQTTEEDE